MGLDPAFFFIFGGCCSNVFALEAIVNSKPRYETDSGILITATQLLFAALVALPSQIEHIPPQQTSSSSKHSHGSLSSHLLPFRLKTPKIPFNRLALLALLFCVVNMMNNWAFAFSISVPMHIILRSFGSVTTLTVGWLVGKRYSRVQVASVVGLTIGVVVSAWADARSKGAKMDLTATSKPDSTTSSFASGLVVLFVAQVLAAILGIYTEKIYATYGRHWLENLFYTHFLGFLFSLVFIPTLHIQLSRLLAGPRFSIPTSVLSVLTRYLPDFPSPIRALLSFLELPIYPVFALLQRLTPWSGAPPSTSLLLLLLNAATQVICISGVNRLAATTTAVTVTVVLNIRKLASFLLSCLIFGNKLSGLMMVGASIVFVSGGVYGWDSSRQGKQGKKEHSDDAAKRSSAGAVRGAADVSEKDRENGTVLGTARDVDMKTNGDGIGTRTARSRRRGD